jgi:Zn finger protein HypA/HybF involved in hydrogenase expression
MSKSKKVKFKCPNCGSDQLKSIEQADIVQVSQKIEIEDNEI